MSKERLAMNIKLTVYFSPIRHTIQTTGVLNMEIRCQMECSMHLPVDLMLPFTCPNPIFIKLIRITKVFWPRDR